MSTNVRLLPRTTGRLLLTLVLAVLVPLIVVQAGIYYAWYETQLAAEQRSGLELARAAGVAFREYVHDIYRQEASLAVSLEAIGPVPGEQEIHRLLHSTKNLYDAVRAFHLLDANGVIVISSDPNAVGTSTADRAFFAAVRGGRETHTSDLFTSRFTGELVFTIATRLVDANGVFRGAIVAATEPSRLAALAGLKQGDHGTVAIFDSKGMLVLRAGTMPMDRNWLTKDLVLQQALKAGEAAGESIYPMDGQRHVSARTVIPEIGFVAGASRPLAEIRDPIIASLMMASGILLVVAALSVIGTFYIGRRLVNPVRQLGEHARLLGEGRLDRPCKIKGVSEMEELAGAFNTMSSRLLAAQEQERQSAEQVRTMLESITDAFVSLDRDWRYTYVNATAAKALGKTREQMLGRTVWEVFPAAVGTTFEVEFRRAVETDKPVDFEAPYSPLGVWFHCHCYPSPRGLSVFFTDITQRKEAEEALRELAADLERSNKDLEQFAYIASHDLQEPLRIVAGYIQLLQRRYQGRLDNDADEFIAFAVDGTGRMQQLIIDLLAFSRVGTRGRAFEDTSMEQALQEALKRLAQQVADTGAAITCDPLPTLPADASQMIQLLQNLLANAMKFRSNRQPKIHVSARRDGGYWQFAVSDNGIGIEQQYFERIFQIFQRLHTQEKYPGTGIGLALCRKIVERHGGRIWVESKPGEGSVFCFTLRAEA